MVIVSVVSISFVFDAGEIETVNVNDYLSNSTYDVNVIYLGDDNFNNATQTGSVTVLEEPVVELKDPELKATATNTTITVSVNKSATGNVLVDVDGAGYYAVISNSKASVNVIGLDEGDYEATVYYVGDDVFKAANTTVSITVPSVSKNDTPVDSKADIKVSEDGVSAVLPSDATGYVLVDVDGTGYYAPVKDGKASVDLPELTPGNHTVTVSYTGDAKYATLTTSKTITVESELETIISEDLVKIEKSSDRFEANFTDNEGKALTGVNVTFTLNGNTYTRTTDSKGTAGMNINLAAGNYTVTVTNPVTGEVKNNTITVNPRIVENSDLVKYFRNASQYRVKVLDDEGNPAGNVNVTFNINGVFYTRTSDKDGYAQISINLADGEYIITSEYKGCQVSNSIKVLPVLTGSDLTKKYGESGAFEAKLVDGQGNAYANQDVQFNINGVFYTRKTDANGIAKLNINLMAGEYIITSMYGAAVTSNTVTVTA